MRLNTFQCPPAGKYLCICNALCWRLSALPPLSSRAAHEQLCCSACVATQLAIGRLTASGARWIKNWIFICIRMEKELPRFLKLHTLTSKRSVCKWHFLKCISIVPQIPQIDNKWVTRTACFYWLWFIKVSQFQSSCSHLNMFFSLVFWSETACCARLLNRKHSPGAQIKVYLYVQGSPTVASDLL